MNVTKKTLFVLSGALACCVALTLLLTFAGRESSDTPQAATYFFTNYATPDALMAASIENASGTVVVATADGAYYLSCEYDVTANAKTIQALFETVYRLPLNSLLEGASATDAQYGLTTPQATIMLEDLNQDGLIFKIGGQTPDQQSYYACLSGDTRVFLIDVQYASLFLADVDRYYDLSLYPSLADGGLANLRTISVERDGAQAYQLEQIAFSESDNLAYFSLTAPIRLLLGTDQLYRAMLTPLEQLAGSKFIPRPEDLSAYGLTPGGDSLSLTYADGSKITLRIGSTAENNTYVLCENTGMVVSLPTADLAFFYQTYPELVGSELLTLNLNSLVSLSLNERIYRLSGSASDLRVAVDGGQALSADEFQTTVFAALNRISIQGPYDAQAPRGARLLRMEVMTNLTQEPIAVEFYEIDPRRCAISVNGQSAFWCNTVAVNELLAYAATPFA